MMMITMRTSDPSQRSQCPLKTCSRVFTKHQSIIGWLTNRSCKEILKSTVLLFSQKNHENLKQDARSPLMFGLCGNLIATNIRRIASCCNFVEHWIALDCDYIGFELHCALSFSTVCSASLQLRAKSREMEHRINLQLDHHHHHYQAHHQCYAPTTTPQSPASWFLAAYKRESTGNTIWVGAVPRSESSLLKFAQIFTRTAFKRISTSLLFLIDREEN